MFERRKLNTVMASIIGALACVALTTPAQAGPQRPLPQLSPNALVSSTGKVITPKAAAAEAAGERGRSGSTGRVPSSESIIGTDNRMRVDPTTSYPARATGLINRNGSLHCTGWLISRDTILTAGHCVHTGGTSGTWYSGLTFRAGSNGGTAPYGTCSPRGTWALNGWLNSADRQYDAAIIKLNCAVGSTVGWYGMWWQTASLDDEPTVLQGYPGDKGGQQWQSVGSVQATETNRVYYQNDTVGGQSGSPVWQQRSSASFCNGACAMSIHTHGVGGSGPGASYNSGTRITQAKYNTFVSLINTP